MCDDRRYALMGLDAVHSRLRSAVGGAEFQWVLQVEVNKLCFMSSEPTALLMFLASFSGRLTSVDCIVLATDWKADCNLLLTSNLSLSLYLLCASTTCSSFCAKSGIYILWSILRSCRMLRNKTNARTRWLIRFIEWKRALLVVLPNFIHLIHRVEALLNPWHLC
jgi:hypothetical protein